MRIEDRRKSLSNDADSEKPIGLHFKYLQFIACVIGGAWLLLLLTYKVVVTHIESESNFHTSPEQYDISNTVSRPIQRDMMIYGDQYRNIPSRTPGDQAKKSRALGQYAREIFDEARPYLEAFAAESASPETAKNLSPMAQIGQEIMTELKGMQDTPLGKEIITDCGDIAKKVIEKRLGLSDKDPKDKKESAQGSSCCCCCCQSDARQSTQAGDHNRDRTGTDAKPKVSKPDQWSAS